MSVDPPGRAAALARRWHLPFPVLSDPGGEGYLRPLGVWNPEDHGGIAVPALIVVAPDGREVFRSVSRDFADRPTDDDVVAALDRLGLPPADLPPWRPEVEPEEDPGAFRTEAFGHYMRGVRSGSSALARRMVDAADRAEAQAVSTMAASFLDAWKRRRALVG